MGAVKGILGYEVAASAPLANAGLDSPGAVELLAELKRSALPTSTLLIPFSQSLLRNLQRQNPPIHITSPDRPAVEIYLGCALCKATAMPLVRNGTRQRLHRRLLIVG